MLPRTLHSGQPSQWQKLLAQAISDPFELLARLGLPPDILPPSAIARRQFSLRVPRGYVARMRKGDPGDPLLRQIFPHQDEEHDAPGFSPDPVGDLAAMPLPGLLHKYHGRALLVATGACAIHCRYCFRRHFPYGDANPAAGQWDAALDYLASDASITEIILSGGDPLTLTDLRLAPLAQRLSAIPHLKRLRIHTRLPVVLPERVDDGLLAWLGNTRLKPVMVIHANHANEIDDQVRHALAMLAEAGVTLFNQSVLLRGVNDSAQALANLSETLFDSGVTPYYLHLLDKVRGATHFDTGASRAETLLTELRNRLPGYLVPRLVREEAGAPSKLPL
ncbi:MAG: EF-P beta-lysylation protein EpmB [Gammaproteobacteria bacterium]|nr:EF-P beta-lysylation protein EpmB [Gammaproteobacteria bacterium]